MQFFSRNRTHILTRTQVKNIEYTFFVKIVSKGNPLNVAILTIPSYSPSENWFLFPLFE